MPPLSGCVRQPTPPSVLAEWHFNRAWACAEGLAMTGQQSSRIRAEMSMAATAPGPITLRDIARATGVSINTVSRALALWELYRRGFDTHHVFAVDEYYWENRPAYYAALDGVRHGGVLLTATRAVEADQRLAPPWRHAREALRDERAL